MTVNTAFAAPAAYLANIGMATAEMAVMENLLGQLLAAVLGIEAALGQTIYLSSHTAFGRLATLDITASASLPAGSDKLERIKVLTRRARELLQKHNDLPRDIWNARDSAERVAMHRVALDTQIRSLRDLSNDLGNAIKQVSK